MPECWLIPAMGGQPGQAWVLQAGPTTSAASPTQAEARQVLWRLRAPPPQEAEQAAGDHWDQGASTTMIDLLGSEDEGPASVERSPVLKVAMVHSSKKIAS